MKRHDIINQESAKFELFIVNAICADSVTVYANVQFLATSTEIRRKRPLS